MIDKNTLARLTAEVVSSYVGNPSLSEAELDRAVMKLPLLIDRVHEALLRILQGELSIAEPEPKVVFEGAGSPARAAPSTTEATGTTPFPAIPAEDSVHDDYLVCLEDGRRLKILSRHLRVKYGLSPEAYRTKWGLPADYPMACKSYAESRSAVAKRIGLGVGGRGSSPAFVEESRASHASRRR